VVGKPFSTNQAGRCNARGPSRGQESESIRAGGPAVDVGGISKLVGGNNDKLTGGSGPDTFLFRPNFGANTITDFNVINDSIQFDKSIFPNVSDILRNTADSANAAAISDGHGDTITLSGVTLTQLQAHQSDFHLV